MRPFQIKYKNIGEIRHGSPYNLADIVIIGTIKFSIEKNNSWQDKCSWSRDGNNVALVKWKHIKSEPGFIIIVINSHTGKQLHSNWIQGCCHKVRLRNDLTIYYETFTLISEQNGKKVYGLKSNEIKMATSKNKTL
ncbi:MAG: hypothetical protein KDD24_09800 [Flavobacteriales bacterium]|nr:hypothetical protein [Flavobacteriales bacterium]MCB9174177.1 hypothetical protein [Flavobacteriales bacterium]